ncbi:3-methylornithyl-N6-L-lysine dehydrogenase PylD [Zhaonella formicivorans]|uniref:3-methylornithyl-N6-L-lysine dehydrogenase PylD n=1 Tax=Zhaonella formicivorans TaxID=2528593 RepID=UPI0010F3D82C|nr:3-methylornithyl-N6-L-lysine dehydrogenase PylD [Zhaonella formicivorans]
MTRLCSADVRDIGLQLKVYNQQLVKKTGYTLGQIAAHAAGVEKEYLSRRQEFNVAVIPVTNGKGIIEGFGEAVRSIVSFLGFNAFLTESTDVSGLAEACQKGADVIMLADDYRFVAINLAAKKVVDNAAATAKGYVAALSFMAGGLANKEVLLLGAGRVGRNAASAMVQLGASVTIYDADFEVSCKLAQEIKAKYNIQLTVATKLEEALVQHRILFDACPAAGFIQPQHVTTETLIAAPGIPLGLAKSCLPLVADRLLHDPLQLGVATMIVAAAHGSGLDFGGAI